MTNDPLLEWMARNDHWLWGSALAVLAFLGTLIAMPMVVARMPADYFLHRRSPPGSWRKRHRVLRVTLAVLRNLLGLVLVGAGLLMLVLPGPGLFSVLIGVSLLDFPGKRALELRIVRQPRVLAAINWMRQRAGRPPLRLPPGGE